VRLTTFSDYSLRVLIYLAVEPDRRATIDEIASAYDVSKAHLMKVVHELGLRGWVETVRGRGGGLQLAQPPEQIPIGAVVRATEENLALVECFESGPSDCRIVEACVLKRALGEALEAFLGVLDRYTLEQLMHNRGQIVKVLFPRTEESPHDAARR